MAKSVVTLLLGKAIDEGYIKKFGSTCRRFFFRNINKVWRRNLPLEICLRWLLGWIGKNTIRVLFSITARSYYDKNLRDVILGLKVVSPPGESFEYKSGATQLLAMVIEKATKQTLSNYLSQKFWKPMGMERDGNMASRQ